jgi:hypothetical protein
MRCAWNDSHELATLFFAAQRQDFSCTQALIQDTHIPVPRSIMRSAASTRRALTVHWHELTVVSFQQSQILSLIVLPRKPLARSDVIRMVLNSSVLIYAQQELMQKHGDGVVLPGWIAEERVRETVLQ